MLDPQSKCKQNECIQDTYIRKLPLPFGDIFCNNSEFKVKCNVEELTGALVAGRISHHISPHISAVPDNQTGLNWAGVALKGNPCLPKSVVFSFARKSEEQHLEGLTSEWEFSKIPRGSP